MAEVRLVSSEWLWSKYGWRWFKQVGRQIWSFGRDQVLGLILAVLIFLYQLHSGLIQSADQRKTGLETIAYPYLTLVGIYVLYEILRAPFALHHQRERRIRHLESELENGQTKEGGGIGSLLGKYLRDDPQRKHTEAIEHLASEMEKQRSPGVSKVLLAQKGPVATVKFSYENQCVYLLVTNNGVMADFSGFFSVVGGAGDLPCRWLHDPSAKTRIVKGQTCRIILAELITEHAPFWTMRWKIFSALGDTLANYTSVPNAKPEPARAPDLLLHGAVMAEPDLENGIQKFAIVLEAFGARLAKSSDYV